MFCDTYAILEHMKDDNKKINIKTTVADSTMLQKEALDNPIHY